MIMVIIVFTMNSGAKIVREFHLDFHWKLIMVDHMDFLKKQLMAENILELNLPIGQNRIN